MQMVQKKNRVARFYVSNTELIPFLRNYDYSIYEDSIYKYGVIEHRESGATLRFSWPLAQDGVIEISSH